jgi:hypothetical protein
MPCLVTTYKCAFVLRSGSCNWNRRRPSDTMQLTGPRPLSTRLLSEDANSAWDGRLTNKSRNGRDRDRSTAHERKWQ